VQVGLGTGSTAYFAIERLGQHLASGELEDIVCVPTSEATRVHAIRLGIPLSNLNVHSLLDVTIDGADDVDPSLNLVKGGGGALLREKMIEVASKKFICIVDESKLSKRLGPRFPLPVEITPFCHEHTIRSIENLPSLKGCKAVLRLGKASSNANKENSKEIAITDNGNYIVDLYFKDKDNKDQDGACYIKDAKAAAMELRSIVGVCYTHTAYYMYYIFGLYVTRILHTICITYLVYNSLIFFVNFFFAIFCRIDL
jgi:ribose 5-phosphate isomerase A